MLGKTTLLKRKIRKLSLDRETLKTLSEPVLTQIAGGQSEGPSNGSDCCGTEI